MYSQTGCVSFKLLSKVVKTEIVTQNHLFMQNLMLNDNIAVKKHFDCHIEFQPGNILASKCICQD